MALKICKAHPREFASLKGRPICRLEYEGIHHDLTTGNIVQVEKSENTPHAVKSFIGQIWDTLALPGCSIDTELLRHIMDFERGSDGGASFFDRTSDIRENGKKIEKRVSSWVLESEMPLKSQDLVENFFKSKLGILFIRGMINLPSMWTAQLKSSKSSEHLIGTMDKHFMQSPLCCLYVQDIQVDVFSPGSGKTATRTNVKMKRAVPNLVAGFAQYVPSRENLEKAPADSFTIYGQLTSGYAGCLGDYFWDQEEYDKRKRDIEHTWKTIESRNQQETNKRKYKWFDNFAGTDNFSKAAMKMIITDCPPISLWATLSNMKRNLLCLAYICNVYVASVRDNRSCLFNNPSDRKELLTDMAQFVSSFFSDDASLALSSNFPLKMSKQSGTPYLSIKDYIVKSAGGLDGMQFLKKVQNRGLTDPNVLHTLTSSSAKGFGYVPFYNAISMCEMTHEERMCLTKKSHDENKSLVLVPVRLSSWEQNSSCKFSAGVKTCFSNFVHFGVLVGKSSILFDKSDGVSTANVSSEEEIRVHAESYVLLIDDGMAPEEAASAMSITSQQMEKIQQYLAEEVEQPAYKKRKM